MKNTQNRLAVVKTFTKTLFYHEVPSYYTWDDNRGWLKRRRGKDVPNWGGIKMDTAIGR